MPCLRRMLRSLPLVILTISGIFVETIECKTIQAAEKPASKHSAPFVAGFERFHTAENKAASGRLLLGELNCTSCHQADNELKSQLAMKQAPILDGIGSRVSVSFLRKFLANPHAVKPGTTMPQMFNGLSADEKKSQVEALVHFLASTGRFHHSPPNLAAAGSGLSTFRSVGCVACHGPLDGKTNTNVVPLGDPSKKYNMSSLVSFLRDPLKTRPSGRMPSLNLTPQEATAIASHFLRDIKVPTNLIFKYYEGNWNKLPDFSKLKPRTSGGVTGFDLRVARRKNNFGIRYEGFLQIEKPGEYTFFLGSDDGSKLMIDGKTVVINDGIHPYTQKTGKVRLEKGPHPLTVDFFQGGGEWILKVQIQGPGVSRRDVASLVTSTKVPPRPEPGFQVDSSLAKRGRQLFSSVGCASCHQLNENGKRIPSLLVAKPLNQLDGMKGGCLTTSPSHGSKNPAFSLNAAQRSAILAAISTPIKKQTIQETIAQTMKTLNCYACHSRGKQGGPTRELNPLFQTTIKEMGDEGRVPPPLDGVGDKLTDTWLKHVLANGANDRPYMLTRMPKFGTQNAGHLEQAFIKVDRKTAANIPKVKTSPLRLKAAGRFMVGEKAFACIKCHTFGKYKATGIQSLDLTKLTQRIRQDWFHRYMVKPIRYRPGTRMPTPFPGGISTLDTVLDGTPPTQLVAIWTYLKDGEKARIPQGLIRGKIELVPKTEPIIYRNFIQGVSPRGIGVGYPGGFNLAFDADRLVLGLLWHGSFIDAAKHWIGRGPGFQTPLGDHLLTLPRDVPFAVLPKIDAPWPTKSARELGYRFRGYRLNQKRQPIFRYQAGEISIEDFPEPVKGQIDPSLKRTLTLTQTNETPNGSALLFRAAVGKTIKPHKQGWYRVDENFNVRVTPSSSSTQPILRKINGQMELLIPVIFKNGKAILVQEIVW
ncbi:MAG: hypothetical protein Tsb009_37160 [Planctomycetaceae bacterium]